MSWIRLPETWKILSAKQHSFRVKAVKAKTVEFENQYMKLDGPSLDCKLTTDLCQSKLQPNCSNKVSGYFKGKLRSKNELSSIERA